MPPSEQALDDLSPGDKSAIGICLAEPFDISPIISTNPYPESVYSDSQDTT